MSAQWTIYLQHFNIAHDGNLERVHPGVCEYQLHALENDIFETENHAARGIFLDLIEAFYLKTECVSAKTLSLTLNPDFDNAKRAALEFCWEEMHWRPQHLNTALIDTIAMMRKLNKIDACQLVDGLIDSFGEETMVDGLKGLNLVDDA